MRRYMRSAVFRMDNEKRKLYEVGINFFIHFIFKCLRRKAVFAGLPTS